jgi:hypothetical protein
MEAYMGKLFKLINLNIFNHSSPYNSSYSRIGEIIENGEVSKLKEISKAKTNVKPSKLKIRSTDKEAA